MKIYLSLFLYLLSSSVLASSDHQLVIQELLKAIENSEAVFERNGAVHSAAKASEHLEHKLKQARRWSFRNDEITVQQFIDNIASRSSISGKDYFIIFEDGTRLTMREWLAKRQSEKTINNAKEI